MQTLKTYRSAFAVHLLFSVAVVFFIVNSNLLGQSTPPVDQNGNLLAAANTEATAERVIVTGSNIPTAEEVGPNPVENYTRDNLQKSGDRTTEQFLRNLPISNAQGIPISNNENGSNTAVGAATIALRGFDSRATLILLDGRRVAPYPTGNNPGLVNAMFVDLNSIPQAAIESIEILERRRVHHLWRGCGRRCGEHQDASSLRWRGGERRIRQYAR